MNRKWILPLILLSFCWQPAFADEDKDKDEDHDTSCMAYTYTAPAMRSGTLSAPITLTSPCGGGYSGSSEHWHSSYTGSKSVSFKFSNVQPSSGTAKLLVKNSDGTQTLATLTAGATASVPLTFSSSGKATFTLLYADAGQIALTVGTGESSSDQDKDKEDDKDSEGHSKITICHYPPGNPSNMQTLSISSSAWSAHQAHNDTQGACGSAPAGSNTITVTPYLLLNATSDSNTPVVLNSADHTGAATWKAGKDFRLSLMGITDPSVSPVTTTPNYKPGSVNLTVATSNPTVASGGTAGTLVVKDKNGTDAAASITASDAGASGDDTAKTKLTALFANGALSKDGTGSFLYGLANYNEVGVITLTASDSDYYDTSLSSGAVTVGRFTPDRFAIATVGTPSLKPANGNFTYIGQIFEYATKPKLTVTAQNAAGATTQNYDGNFWKLDETKLKPAYTDKANANATLTSVGATMTLTKTGAGLGKGVGSIEITDTLAYTHKQGLQPPFQAKVGLDIQTDTSVNATPTWVNQLSDKDGVCYIGSSQTCQPVSGVTGINGMSGTELRYGRLAIGSATGSASEGATVPVMTQYVNSQGRFVQNTDDNSTTLSPSIISMTASLDAGGTKPTATLSNNQLSQGVTNVILTPPGAGGYVYLTVDVAAAGISYLQSDWGGAGFSNPTMRIAFGVYAGKSAVKKGRIFIREDFNQE